MKKPMAGIRGPSWQEFEVVLVENGEAAGSFAAFGVFIVAPEVLGGVGVRGLEFQHGLEICRVAGEVTHDLHVSRVPVAPVAVHAGLGRSDFLFAGWVCRFDGRSASRWRQCHSFLLPRGGGMKNLTIGVAGLRLGTRATGVNTVLEPCCPTVFSGCLDLRGSFHRLRVYACAAMDSEV